MNFFSINMKLVFILQRCTILLITSLSHLLLIYKSHKIERKEFSEAKTLEIENKKVNDFLSILVPKFVRYLMTQGIFSLSQPQNAVSVLFCDICNFDDIAVVTACDFQCLSNAYEIC